MAFFFIIEQVSDGTVADSTTRKNRLIGDDVDSRGLVFQLRLLDDGSFQLNRHGVIRVRALLKRNLAGCWHPLSILHEASYICSSQAGTKSAGASAKTTGTGIVVTRDTTESCSSSSSAERQAGNYPAAVVVCSSQSSGGRREATGAE